MPQPPKSRGPILGSFESIGENVAKQVKSLPGDVVGAAIESITTGTTAKSPTTNQTSTNPAFQQLQSTPDEGAKKTMARQALQALSSVSKPKEPSIWEQIQQEEEQKKQHIALQKKKQLSELPLPSSKRSRGDLYGIKAKRQGSEIGKNVKHD